MMKSEEMIERSRIYCWEEIGVRGDRSCPKLEEAIHCRFCDVFREKSTEQLSSEAPEDYLISFYERLKKQEGKPEKGTPLVLFNLGRELLGIPVHYVKSIVKKQKIYPIPRLSRDVFLGLVNIEGSLELCFSLHALLLINEVSPNPYFVSLYVDGSTWVFPVDEVIGIYRYKESDLGEPQAYSELNHYAMGTILHNRKTMYWLKLEQLVRTVLENLQ